MKKYNFLTKAIHNIALSSQYSRETAFDIENIFFNDNTNRDENVFITGMARSGTTILLNSIYQSNNFASITYADMPFILSPNLFSLLNLFSKDFKKIQRYHDDGIYISLFSPEAFEEVFWKTFYYGNQSTYKKFINYINFVQKKYDKERYLSKNNQNLLRLNFIGESFPNSNILICIRNPLQQSFSILKQHKKFLNKTNSDPFIGRYLELIGHSEFGSKYKSIYDPKLYKDPLDINHWLEQWSLIYTQCKKESLQNKNIKFINYERLCKDKNIWNKLQKLINIDLYDFEFQESNAVCNESYDSDLYTKCINLYDEITDLSI